MKAPAVATTTLMIVVCVQWLCNSQPTAAPVASLLLVTLITACDTVDALTCMTCAASRYQTTQLDSFRVSARLQGPRCAMEPIECERSQDICVSITMHVGGGHYWIGTGCDRREHFRHVRTCENVRTLARNVQLGAVHERRAIQRVCVCSTDRCNRAPASSGAVAIALALIVHFLVALPLKIN